MEGLNFFLSLILEMRERKSSESFYSNRYRNDFYYKQNFQQFTL